MKRVFQIIRKFFARKFSFIFFVYYNIYFKLLKLNEPVVIILTPGKVGSTTVYKAMKKELNLVFHLHNFTKDSIEKSIIVNKKSSRGYAPLHLIKSKYLLEKVKKNNSKIFLICLIREPIKREVSSIFQNIEMFKETVKNNFLKIDNDEVALLIKNRLGNDTYLKELENWFNEQLFESFGFDIYSFNLSKGYHIKKSKKVDLLFMRLEDLSNYFSTALSEYLPFLNKKILLAKENVSYNKFYNLDYMKIRKNIDLSKYENQEHYFNNKFVKFFYDPKT